ncbi:MAG: LysR family transcriptional regulator [Gammaproteobacteria bacterium]|nr:LysR family transcriptional regulator [Gammaproteobacteria bacterium]
MEHRQLERFLAVIEQGSLAAAARHLHLTQQALSASLANLEKDLGVRLFDRSPGGITQPTPHGTALIRHARAQLAGAERARQELLAMSDGRTGTVTVGLGESFAGDIIAEAVLRFRRARPGIRVNLIEGYSEKLRHRLYDGEFDFIAAGVSAYELAEGFTREVIYSANDVIAVRPEHPLAQRRGLTLRDLEGHAWLVPYSRPADLEAIVEAFVAENLEPPRAIVGSDAYRIGMQLLLASDLLIMVSPALIAPELARPPPALQVLAINRPTVQRNASLIYPADRPLTPAAALLLDEVRAVARSTSRFPASAPAATAAGGARRARGGR